MIYWLIVGMLAILFRSYGWDAIAPKTMDAALFYQVYDIFGSIALLCTTKAAAYGRSLKNRLFIDFILAFIYADIIDRCCGITELQAKDWIIVPLWLVGALLVYWKHHYYSRRNE